jgi:hypothetical protein
MIPVISQKISPFLNLAAKIQRMISRKKSENSDLQVIYFPPSILYDDIPWHIIYMIYDHILESNLVYLNQ